MKLSGQRVLVTGAGGFIGSHLVERLVELGAQVRALVHYNSLDSWGWLDSSPRRHELEVVAGDIGDLGSVRHAMRDCRVVFHLAALIAIPYSYRAPASYVHTNVGGTLNVLEAARECSVQRLVHTSTSEVYGTALRVPIDEGHPLQGQSPYSATKIGADKLAEAFQRSFDVPVVTVRPFNTFGPRQSARAVIPTIIAQCLAGDIVRLGNLEARRDLNYVANTVEGYVLAASTNQAVGRTVNLGSGADISIGELAQLIARLLGREIMVVGDPQRLRPERSEVDRLVADNTLARSLLGWHPTVSLEDGLRKTIAWMQENQSRYRPHDYTI
jgi:dTDP-glucose 4,6-dehydratase